MMMHACHFATNQYHYFALGPLAQLVEQRTFNPLVEGSNPSRPILVNTVNTTDHAKNSLLWQSY